MYYYRQHLIVLFAALCECVLLGLLGMVLALRFGQPLCFSLTVLGLLGAIRRGLAWAVFCVRLKGQHITMRSLRGLTVSEQVVSFVAHDGLRMRQNILGYLLDYGDLQIQTFDQPVKFLYIASCSTLRRQLDRS